MLRNTLNTFITATFIMLLGVSSTAQAIVPMGDLMGSTSVTFTGQAEATTYPSAIRVDLVPAESTIREHGGLGDREVEGNKVTVTYTITSEANGPDKYTLAAPYDSNAEGNENAGDLTTEILGAEGQDSASVDLGATAATGPADPDGTTITVPSDGGDGTVVNGISVGDKVVIGQDYATPYDVISVADDGNTATIELNDVPAGIELGTQIAEQKTFKVVVSGKALLNPAEQVKFALKVTGMSADGNQIGTASLAHTIEGAPDMPTFEKYARNLTDPNGNPAAANVESTEFNSGGGLFSYYKTGVSAKDTHEVEILIVLNAGNQGPQTDIVLTETLSPFVQYVPGSSRLDGDVFTEEFEEAALIIDSNHLKIPGGENIPELNIDNKSSAKVTYKVKVMGGVGGDIGLKTIEQIEAECNGDNPGLFSIETCKGQPWVAANGIDVAKNPVCWDTKYDDWQEDGENPWVVGTAAEYNNGAYDCRTKCADESGESFGHCAADGWWLDDTAKSTTCEMLGEVWRKRYDQDITCYRTGRCSLSFVYWIPNLNNVGGACN